MVACFSLFTALLPFNSRSKTLLFAICIITFWLVSILRWETGTDWDSYYNFFSNNTSLQEFNRELFEPIFTCINYLIKLQGFHYSILLFVFGTFIYTLSSSTIYRYSPLPIVSLLLYLLIRQADMLFVRESIALAILFFSTKFIVERNPLKFISAIVLASGFHYSAIIFIPAYYIYSQHFDLKKILYMLAGVTVLSIFGKLILIVMSNYIGGTLSWKLSAYLLNTEYDFGYDTTPQNAIISGIINRGGFLTLFYWVKTKNEGHAIINGLFNLYLISVLLFFFFVPISLALSRFVNSYEMSAILLIGYFFQEHKIRTNKAIILSMFIIYIFIRFYSSTLVGAYSDEYIPYRSIL